MTDTEANKKIQQMIKDGCSDIDVLTYVKGECQGKHLSPQTLGMIFELYSEVAYDENNELSGFSRAISISELRNIHPDFATTNGCQWARSDSGYLGRRYIIKRTHSNNRVSTIKLDGLNLNSVKVNRHIRSDIRDQYKDGPCRILDITTQIEIDHKNGRYNTLSNIAVSEQKASDFQPLSKAANDAKRSHCKECIATGKRYDARHLGYKEAYIVGNEDTQSCAGCYWYDPQRFNQMISKDFKKEM